MSSDGKHAMSESLLPGAGAGAGSPSGGRRGFVVVPKPATTVFGMELDHFFWLIVFCATGVGLGMTFEFMELHSSCAPLRHSAPPNAAAPDQRAGLACAGSTRRRRATRSSSA